MINLPRWNKDESSTILPENCTSVSWDVEELGSEAAKLLMAEQFNISKKFFPAHLVPGKTVRRLSADDRKWGDRYKRFA